MITRPSEPKDWLYPIRFTGGAWEWGCPICNQKDWPFDTEALAEEAFGAHQARAMHGYIPLTMMRREPEPPGYIQALWCHSHLKNERAWGWFGEILGGRACFECNHMYRTGLHLILAEVILRHKLGMSPLFRRLSKITSCPHCSHSF